MLDLVVIQVQVLQCSKCAKDFRINMRDEVLPQTETLEVLPKSREAKLVHACGIQASMDEFNLLEEFDFTLAIL